MVLRFGGAAAGGLKFLDGFTGREAGRSSSRSELPSALSASPGKGSSSSSSLSSTISGTVFFFAGAAGLLVAPALLLSDSAVGIRGTCEGRCGLNGGAFRFDAA